jgi:hypothetical protein
MVKVKMGAVVREINEGALKWFEMAGWKVLKKEKKVDKTDSKKTTTTPSDI